MPTALVTGSAGFIGLHLCQRFVADGWSVQGIDAMLPRYDPALKAARLELLNDLDGYTHSADRIEAPGVMLDLVARTRPDIIVHLAGEAGVRQSIDEPRAYLQANILGTFEVLEAARAHPPRHLLMASTSSAYGAIAEMPYSETMRADWPVSFYAATKKSTEIMAHSHAHTYGLPITMFRFFTVYGPWGRPDMAYYLFTDAILNGRPIDVFNHGRMKRDFVYVDDLIASIMRLADAVPPRTSERGDPIPGDSLSPVAPMRVVNIGKSAPDSLEAFIEEIEKATGVTAVRNYKGMQPGDMEATWADASLLKALTGTLPSIPLSEGIPRFVSWYRAFHGRNI